MGHAQTATGRLHGLAEHSGQFVFLPITDLTIDQTQTQIVLDREIEIAAMGLAMRQVRSDPWLVP